jgi:phospholipase D1/2
MSSVLRVPHNAFVQAEVTESALLIDARTYYCTVYRALEQAQSYVVVSGWQFDSGVKLLRGEDAAAALRPVKFLDYLAALCAERPKLTVYVLAWDFSLVYATQRESEQREKFTAAHTGIRFEWDAHPTLTGSHHQKFLVVDGQVGFLGGIDLCDARWDDCTHHAHNPDRVNVSGDPCKPYHDVQAAFSGPIVSSLVDLFVERWARVTNERLELAKATCVEARFDLKRLSNGEAEAISATHAALSRTQADSRAEAVFIGEILHLFADAIGSAQRLIYAETQYFTSRSLARILVARISDVRLPKLDIVVVMPHGADTGLERLALADAQDGVLLEVLDAAREHGHAMHVVYPASHDAQGGEHSTFIHSKLLIVDDRLLIVGSANFTERSVALDTELSMTWECGDARDPLGRCIRTIRTRLLAEHSGLSASEFDLEEGLCRKLGTLLETGNTRLRKRAVDEPGPLGPLLAEMFDAGESELTRSA